MVRAHLRADTFSGSAGRGRILSGSRSQALRYPEPPPLINQRPHPRPAATLALPRFRAPGCADVACSDWQERSCSHLSPTSSPSCQQKPCRTSKTSSQSGSRISSGWLVTTRTTEIWSKQRAPADLVQSASQSSITCDVNVDAVHTCCPVQLPRRSSLNALEQTRLRCARGLLAAGNPEAGRAW